jgi:hypothetical protein
MRLDNQYMITLLQTSDVRAAGTDAAVHLSLHGTLGTAELKVPASSEHLNLENSRNNFERGALDEFVLPRLPRLDAIGSITIGHNGKGLLAAWHLAWVEVSTGGGVAAYFPYNDWIPRASLSQTRGAHAEVCLSAASLCL